MKKFRYCPLCGMEIDTPKCDMSCGVYCIKCQCQELLGNDSIYKMERTAYEDFFDTENTAAKFGGNRRRNEENLMLLRYYHSRAQQRNPDGRLIDKDFIEMVTKQRVPSINEQLDNLILWCGDYRNKYKNILGEFLSHGHIIGSQDNNMFDAVIREAKKREYLCGNTLDLAFNGLLKYEECKNSPKGYGAFMAMKFGDNELDIVIKNCFVPAVNAVGFNLKKLDDEPKAGLIDNRLRQEIRLARFIIADLTHGNNGAYWEAGYAEGLGKPVIYTCGKKVFEEIKTHFDTNHHQTVIWDKDNLKTAEDSLKATIRCTIPEAKQSDERE